MIFLELALFRDFRLPAISPEKAWWSSGAFLPFLVVWLAAMLHAVSNAHTVQFGIILATATGLVRIAPAVLAVGVDFEDTTYSTCAWIVLACVSTALGYLENALPGWLMKRFSQRILSLRYLSPELREAERARLGMIGTTGASKAASEVHARAELHDKAAAFLQMTVLMFTTGLFAHFAHTLSHALATVFPPANAPGSGQLWCLSVVLLVGTTWLLYECCELALWLVNVRRLVGVLSHRVRVSNCDVQPVTTSKPLRTFLGNLRKVHGEGASLRTITGVIASSRQITNASMRLGASFSVEVNNESQAPVYYEPVRLFVKGKWTPPGKKHATVATLAKINVGTAPGPPVLWSVEGFSGRTQDMQVQGEATNLWKLMYDLASSFVNKGSHSLPEFTLCAEWQRSATVPMPCAVLPAMSFDPLRVDLAVFDGLKLVGGLLYSDSQQRTWCWEQMHSSILPWLPEVAALLSDSALADVHAHLGGIVQGARKRRVGSHVGKADAQFVLGCNALVDLNRAIHQLSVCLRLGQEARPAEEAGGRTMPHSGAANDDLLYDDGGTEHQGIAVSRLGQHTAAMWEGIIQPEDSELLLPHPLDDAQALQADDSDDMTDMVLQCMLHLLAALDAHEAGAALLNAGQAGECSSDDFRELSNSARRHLGQLIALAPSILVTVLSSSALDGDSALLAFAQQSGAVSSQHVEQLQHGASAAAPAVDLMNLFAAGGLLAFLYSSRYMESLTGGTSEGQAGETGAVPAGADGSQIPTQGVSPDASANTSTNHTGRRAAMSAGTDGESVVGEMPALAACESQKATAASGAGDETAKPRQEASSEQAVPNERARQIGAAVIEYMRSPERPFSAPMHMKQEVAACKSLSPPNAIRLFNYVQPLYESGQLGDGIAEKLGKLVLHPATIPKAAPAVPVGFSLAQKTKQAKQAQAREEGGGKEDGTAEEEEDDPPKAGNPLVHELAALTKQESLSPRGVSLVRAALGCLASVPSLQLPQAATDLIGQHKAAVASGSGTAEAAIQDLCGHDSGRAGAASSNSAGLGADNLAAFWQLLGPVPREGEVAARVRGWLAEASAPAEAVAVESTVGLGGSNAGGAASLGGSDAGSEMHDVNAEAFLDSLGGKQFLRLHVLVLDIAGVDFSSMNLEQCTGFLRSTPGIQWTDADQTQLETAWRVHLHLLSPSVRIVLASSGLAAFMNCLQGAESGAAFKSNLDKLASDADVPPHAVHCMNSMFDALTTATAPLRGPQLPPASSQQSSFVSWLWASAPAADGDAVAGAAAAGPIPDQAKRLESASKAALKLFKLQTGFSDAAVQRRLAQGLAVLFEHDEYSTVAAAAALHIAKLRECLASAPQALALFALGLLADAFVRYRRCTCDCSPQKQGPCRMAQRHIALVAQVSHMLESLHTIPSDRLADSHLFKQLTPGSVFSSVLKAVERAAKALPAEVHFTKTKRHFVFRDVAGRFSAQVQGMLQKADQKGDCGMGQYPDAPTVQEVLLALAPEGATRLQHIQAIQVAAVYFHVKLFFIAR